MGHYAPDHRIVGWILEPSDRQLCWNCCQQSATVMVALYGDLCAVEERCDACIPRPAVDDIADTIGRAFESPSTTPDDH